MDSFYHTAEAIVSSTQQNLDGGIFTFFLDYLLNVHNSPQNHSLPPLSAHFAATIRSGGFPAGIFFGFLWCLGLVAGFIYIWWLKHRKSLSSISPRLPENQLHISKAPSGIGGYGPNELDSSTKSKFFLRRRRLQSKWVCIASQCVVLTSLVCLLFFLCILGFVVSYSLHLSLTAKPQKNSTLLLNHTSLFPGITSALTKMRLYLTEFLNETRTATAPAVEDLIRATVEMQNATTHEFNAIIFSMLNIDRAFVLGDKLGAHTVNLLNLVTPLKNDVLEYTDAVSSLSVAIARWNGYMEQIHMETNLTSMKPCEMDLDCNLPILLRSDIAVSSHWRLPQFDFAIALNFVTDAQNRTPEVIEEQLKSGRQLAARQLGKALERMRVELNIPGSLRNLTEENLENIAGKLSGSIVQIDKLAEIVAEKIHPLFIVGSAYIFAFGCFIWLDIFCIVLGISLLLYQYHCLPVTIPPRKRQRIRCIASFCLIFLAFNVAASCAVFLVAGYAQTEFCRYISPDRAIMDINSNKSTKYPITFLLDVHVNAFLDANWDKIVQIIGTMDKDSKGNKIPVPRIRSPVKALNVACKENVGILEAFEAVDTFNFSILNKPQVIGDFVNKGKIIMRDTLLELNATEIFPPALAESVQLASRLDDFLIPFDKVRQQLPKNFLNVTSHNTTLLMSGTELSGLWNDYYHFLNQSGFPHETLNRADELASIVFNFSSKIKMLLESVDESLQKLEKLQKIGPTVSELQGIFNSIIDQLRDRQNVITEAMKLYDVHVANELPKKAEELIFKYGPALVKEVGHCRKLHDAYATGVSAVCDFVVEPLNGLWFFTSLCTLLATALIPLGLYSRLGWYLLEETFHAFDTPEYNL
ncbi:unnamed protein product [Mesocestoides corti]|uniref:Prominin n=1 Tax=Mesocestoides corti TaxID=53468 RepID=A0A0R3UH79_MESCO|nr:unnamed protein product [Mesocestoides corti]